jgi:hypothetical protein
LLLFCCTICTRGLTEYNQLSRNTVAFEIETKKREKNIYNIPAGVSGFGIRTILNIEYSTTMVVASLCYTFRTVFYAVRTICMLSQKTCTAIHDISRVFIIL